MSMKGWGAAVKYIDTKGIPLHNESIPGKVSPVRRDAASFRMQGEDRICFGGGRQEVGHRVARN